MGQDLIHKTNVALFLNMSSLTTMPGDLPYWERIKKTDTFSITMNPQTKTFDFITSVTPSTEIDSYQPALSQSMAIYRDEPEFQFVFDKFMRRATGKDAHVDVLIVFYTEKADKEVEDTTGNAINARDNLYKAWKVDALMSLNQLDTVGQKIDFDLNLNEIVYGAALPDTSDANNQGVLFEKGAWQTTNNNTIFVREQLCKEMNIAYDGQ